MRITELVGMLLPVAVLIVNEVAHALRDHRDRRERLSHQALQNRVQASNEIFRTVSQDFYRLFDHEEPEEIAAIAHKLSRNLRRITLANAAVIGETIEKNVYALAEGIEWLEAKADRCVEVYNLGGEDSGKALEIFRSQIVDDVEMINLCKDALKKTIRVYTGDDVIDQALKKAAEPSFIDRLKRCIDEHRRKKSDDEKRG